MNIVKSPAAKQVNLVNQIPGASDESLIRCLLTPDGKGESIKTAALTALIDRAKREAVEDFCRGISRAK